MNSSVFTNDNRTEMITVWDHVKSFFNAQNSLIILAILCLMFFVIVLCLLVVIIKVMRKKPSPSAPVAPPVPLLVNHPFPKHDPQRIYPPTPIQTGLTSNQIQSLGTIVPSNASQILSTMSQEKSVTQSFDHFENELKRTWHEKGLISTPNPPTTTDDEVETVNEVLGMEERNGKVYYKVNFTGHPSDYTAWVCEEDLIPE